MLKEVSFKHKKRKIRLKAKKVTFFGKFVGLMFKSKEKAKILLFEFKKPTKIKIHSLFVFFPFIAVWLDGKNKIVKIIKIKPFTLSMAPSKPFMKLIEIPINSSYMDNVKTLISRR